MDFIDQMNRTIRLDKMPKRIVSLVPSITELLSYFDMDEEVVGITKFCIKPETWFKEKTRIGGTKQIHLDTIRALKPDLIIANKEENTQEIVETLEKEFPTYVTDINTLEETYEAIRQLSFIFGKEEYAQKIIQDTKEQFLTFRRSETYPKIVGKTYLYFIWHQPDMVAGRETYINDIFQHIGLINATKDIRYPETQHTLSPDYIFLSSEPYPFAEKHIPYFQERYPDSEIMLVDGEIFSWYGSRILHIIPYVHKTLG